MVPDRLVDLLLDRVEIERRRVLHRRVVDRRRGEGTDLLLNHDEPPELAAVEVVHVPAALIVETLAEGGRRARERIRTDVHQRRDVGRGLRGRPTTRLLIELEPEVVETDGPEVWPTEVEQLVARGRTGAREHRHLVVAVEVVLVVAVAEL